MQKKDLKWDSLHDDFDKYYEAYWEKHRLGAILLSFLTGRNTGGEHPK